MICVVTVPSKPPWAFRGTLRSSGCKPEQRNPSRIEGHVRLIKHMVEEGTPCLDVLVQIAAVRIMVLQRTHPGQAAGVDLFIWGLYWTAV